ncbi:MAG: FtsW/RodA/SpoVE family cell cycle protein [Bacteroidaceae bacterium]|nr:FtsW/RodA/SpoVE family cell cycle protein [Bacteroidaceae bacterium]
MDNIRNLLDRISRPKGDRMIWLTVFVLLSISVVEVFSASSRLTFGKSSFLSPIVSHGIHIVFGLVVMYACHLHRRFNYRLLSALLMLLSLAGLALLSLKGIGTDKAQRWIDLKVIQIQPSEFAKLAVVLCVSKMLAKLDRTDPMSQQKTFKKILVLTGIVCLLIVGENLSTALLIGAVVLMLMILGGISWKKLLSLVAILLFFAAMAVVIFKTVPPQTIRDSRIIPSRAVTWQARVLDFMDHDHEYSAAEYARVVAPDKTQETHANIAIATSGIIGKLPGNSNERDYLQEANCDFIFAIIIEELGMLGALFVMAVYLFLLIRVGRIVMDCKRAGKMEQAYMAAGIGLLLGTQAFLNMSVAVGLGPVTGQPMPLISKGGSSMLMSSLCIGILLGISASFEDKADAEEQPASEMENETETFDC